MHEQNFFQEFDIQNNTNICDVVNHHLYDQSDFDILWNKFKYYLPNLMRHHGKVDKDQVPHLDYSFTEKVFKKKIDKKKENEGSKVCIINILLYSLLLYILLIDSW